MTTIVFDLLVETKNPSNGNFGNSRIAAMAQHGVDKKQRKTAATKTRDAMRLAGVGPADVIPARVTLTRFSAGELDRHDNLRSALKRIVDGIAEALGVNDGGPFVSWDYEQGKCPPKLHGVRVRIERRA